MRKVSLKIPLRIPKSDRCRCKKHVAADKQFTVHDAPMVLTVHLKRFSPMGRKIPHPVRYDERISLQPVMSEGQHGPTYTLFGVISHAGGGPSSGHYYAHIKDATGQWHEMNDDSVSRQSGAPLGMKNAYVLFYIREKGQALEAVVSQPQKPASTSLKPGLVASMKKRKVVESDDEAQEGSSPKQRRFIGPLLPSPSIEKPDPQAEALKKKIAKQTASPTKPSSALLSLSQYADDDDDDDLGEKVSLVIDKPLPEAPAPATDAEDFEIIPTLRAASPTAASSSTPTQSKILGPVSAQSFYASSSKSDLGSGKQHKHEDKHSSPLSQYAQSPLKHDRKHKRKFRGGSSPFNRLTGGNTLSFSSPRKRLQWKTRF